ncbi:uncharacterized protein [Ptychodera flava]|uniref:uncharacterized protein n=1 Tax=Ptychodera flava TaxID=63121 RepID=UPI003969EEA9
MAGHLTDADLKEYYGSDASPFFKTYIVDPKVTKENTDRFLIKRIKDVIGPTFYLTNIGEKTLTAPIRISVKFNTSLFNVTGLIRIPVIIFWHTDLQEWQDASHSCKASYGNYDINWDDEVITVEVCATDTKTRSTTGKSKPAAKQAYFSGPTEFTFASLGSFQNSPPRITSTGKLWLHEDGGTVRFKVKADDDEGDDVIFRLDDNLAQPQLGRAILSKDGELTYRPCLDCFGTDYIHYVVTEDREDDSDLLSTFATLEVEVRERNDNPNIFLAVDHVSVLQDSNYEFDVILEERKETEKDTTYMGFQAIAGAYDPDTFDVLKIMFHLPEHGHLYTGPQFGDVSFIHQDCAIPDNITENHLSYNTPDTNVVVFPCGLDTQHEENRLAWVFSALRYVPDEGYFGEDTFKINAMDQNRYHSDVVVVRVHILANPCMNGAVCVGPASDPDCTRAVRSQGFHDYSCECQQGYVGEYCETEHNKCDDSPCRFNYTCTKTADAYICHCENPKWPCGEQHSFPYVIVASVSASGALLLIIIAVIVWRRRRAKTEVEVTLSSLARKNKKFDEDGVTIWNAAFEMGGDVFSMGDTEDEDRPDDTLHGSTGDVDQGQDNMAVLSDAIDNLVAITDQDVVLPDSSKEDPEIENDRDVIEGKRLETHGSESEKPTIHSITGDLGILVQDLEDQGPDDKSKNQNAPTLSTFGETARVNPIFEEIFK